MLASAPRSALNAGLIEGVQQSMWRSRRSGHMGRGNISGMLDPESLKRLVDIGNRLYILNLTDHWSREEREEYVKLTEEREKLRRGE